MRLGDPDDGVTPDRSAVLADREVEATIGVGHRLGVAGVEGELHSVVVGQPSCGLELALGVVDADDATGSLE